MNAFIIPIIHPNHGSISSYSEILNMLRKTLHSIKQLDSKVIVIIICHSIPSWHRDVKKFTIFIKVNSILFDLHHKLDYLTFLKNSNEYPETTIESNQIKEILSEPETKLEFVQFVSKLNPSPIEGIMTESKTSGPIPQLTLIFSAGGGPSLETLTKNRVPFE